MLRTLPSTLHRYPPYRKIEPAAPKHLHRRVDIVMAATVDSDYSSRRSSSNEQRESIMLPGCDSTPLLTLTSTLLLLFCKTLIQKTQNRAWRSNEELEDLVNDSRSHSKSKRVTLKQNHKFLIKVKEHQEGKGC
ncbi:unnamed protein product [Brassica oleracea var. botrytis]|uniref:(rape) hypothetical protein n=1 Tax=Brassica napus TaxID=3708 RepID=A0A816JK89_BRANA|nr:unnamed protein product [Brassica napus]